MTRDEGKPGKLVRDRIPEIIRASGADPVVRTLTGEELIAALFDKLAEEASELREAGPLDAAEEMADVMEVVLGLGCHAPPHQPPAELTLGRRGQPLSHPPGQNPGVSHLSVVLKQAGLAAGPVMSLDS